MAEAAVAEVSIIPVARGAASRIENVLDGQGAGEALGDQVGGGMTSRMRSVLLGTGAVVLGAAFAGLGATLVAGFNRLEGIDNARAKLQGLDYDAQQVDAVMTDALASVKGTAFGLDSAATVAASAVAAGIEPGDALQRTLSLVADTATIAGGSMEELGSIFNKVAASNRLSMAEVNQLSDRGIPVLSALADQLGVTQGEVANLVSQGAVDFATFQAAMEGALGGAAAASGTTFSGALANVEASISRIGAGLLGGVFPSLAPLFQSLTTALGPLEESATAVGDQIGAALTPAIQGLSDWLATVDFTAFTNGITTFIGALTSGDLESAGGSIGALFSELEPNLPAIGQAFSDAGSALGTFAGQASGLVAPALGLLTGALGFLADNMETIAPFLPAIVAGFLLWNAASRAGATYTTALRTAELAAAPIYLANNIMRTRSVTIEGRLAAAKLAAAGATGTSAAATAGDTAATAANTTAQNAGLGTRIRATAAMVAQRVAMVAGAAASGIATAAQWALNAAMSANPIMLIVIAIAALVAGLIWFFTQTELGQEIWANFTRFLGEAWANVSAWFMAVGEGIATWWNGLWSGIGQFWTDLWNNVTTFVSAVFTGYVNGLMAIGNGIATWWNGLWNGIGSFFSGLWSGITSAARSLFQGYVSWLFGIGSSINSWWSGLWNGIGSFFNGVWNGIVGAFNGIPGVIKGAINSAIRAVNGAIGGINDVLAAGGAVFGIDLAIPRIPLLAAGGIVSGPTLAVIGEGRYQEAVVPLGPKFYESIGGNGDRGGATVHQHFEGMEREDPAYVQAVAARAFERAWKGA